MIGAKMPIDPSDLTLPSADELRDRLVGWCVINSGSGNLAGLERMRGELRAALRELPGKLEEPDLGPGWPRALTLRCRPDAPLQVLLNIHFDTVYGPAHSFQTCESIGSDTLRGPGVADAKGGILVLVTALRAFEQLPGAKRMGWTILLGPDEETGSHASEPLYREAARRHHLGLVFEPARENGDLVRARKGIGLVVATCHGRAAHAAKGAELGRNAILALAEYLVLAARAAGPLAGVSLNVGRVSGGTAANIVPDLATAEIDVRSATVAGGESVLEALRQAALAVNTREGFSLELSGGFQRAPLEATPEREALLSEYVACGRALGLAFGAQAVGGGSDGNLLAAAGLPVLDGLGPVGGDLHSEREWIRVSSLRERAGVAALFLARLNAGEIVLPDAVRLRPIARE